MSVRMRELLGAGGHFGHLRSFWNPKMAPYIYTTKQKVDIIDLDQTIRAINDALAFTENTVRNGNSILFVGTKRSAKQAIQEQADRCRMPYVNHRWLGGTLTNWRTIRGSIKRMEELALEIAENSGLTKKEKLIKQRHMDRLRLNLEGIKSMGSPPDALFLVDVRHERIAVSEARKMGIPVIALVDTDSDPDSADYLIPVNDDSSRAVRMVVSAMADACIAAGSATRPAEKSEEDKLGFRIDRKGGGEAHPSTAGASPASSADDSAGKEAVASPASSADDSTGKEAGGVPTSVAEASPASSADDSAGKEAVASPASSADDSTGKEAGAVPTSVAEASPASSADDSASKEAGTATEEPGS